MSAWRRLSAPPWQWALGFAMLGLLASEPARTLLEARMWSHMTVQIPAIAVAAWLLAASLARPIAPLLGRVDRGGLSTAIVLMAVSAYWMVPRALDLVLDSAVMEVGKFVSLCLAGALLRCSWGRMASGVKLFVLATLVWMLWAVGVIMLMAESRLCNAYLFEDQILTGQLCLIWGAVVLLLGSSVIIGRPITPSLAWRWLISDGPAKTPTEH